MTHAELVLRAERWLRNTLRCYVVLAEPDGGGIEVPDAIGWQGTMSHLVECKATRSDFLGDKRKTFRHWGDDALGLYRYYMCPAGIIREHEVPPRWGLLIVHDRSVRRVVKPRPWSLDRPGSLLRAKNELGICLSELGKFQYALRGGPLQPTRSGRRVMAALAGLAPQETTGEL